MNDRVIQLTYEHEQPQRLDKILVAELPTYSRSRLQKLIKEGRVTVDGVIASKSGQKIDGMSQIVVEIPPPQPSTLIPEDIPLDMVFENNDPNYPRHGSVQQFPRQTRSVGQAR